MGQLNLDPGLGCSEPGFANSESASGELESESAVGLLAAVWDGG